MKIRNFFLLSCLLAACNASENETRKADVETTAEANSSVEKCYQYANASDTVRLSLTPAGDSVTGRLVYLLKEKDKNEGTIRGVMKDDVLWANYLFMSEGVESARPVAFKKEGDKFVEGYGDFNNPSSITFSSTMPLTGTECR